ncbi:MAG: hypothetical protein ABIG93_04690 [archaeon]|nr:hypothetical protein [Nanoarchaeota archaeon]
MKLTDKIYSLLMDVVADWNEWIVRPEVRLDLVTRGLLDSGHTADTKLYSYLRQGVDFTGPSKNTAMSLYAHLNKYAVGSIDGFVEAFANEFEERLLECDTNNSNHLLHALYEIKGDK